ncbi:Bax inhibitor 1 [Hondaea fermentalgiana]|uniref:Bax inhibitor 1 n=1 Tax=Hondaea fermentalgiana TaxID=2315210 RepID=A0A2R5GJ07_9STRA|nr:Bax inhibitor 1 [Hondaea fermentalgiana]|eukprot:GBG30595.1 Bax inhibitor 1 [Hondaea fermentalgiana]
MASATSAGLFAGPSESAVQKAFTDGVELRVGRRAQAHLLLVYRTLAAASALAVLGVLVFIKAQIPAFLPFVVSVLCVFAMGMMQDETQRLGVLGLLAFSQGLLAGALVEFALDIDPALPLTAMLITLVVFVGFSVAALYAEKRSMLYLGGTLYSALGMLTTLTMANFFLQSPFVHTLQIYGGLIVFCGYVSFDTQLILAKFEAGDRDYVSHAMVLFVDMMAIFTRVLVVLLRNDKDRNRRRR